MKKILLIILLCFYHSLYAQDLPTAKIQWQNYSPKEFSTAVTKKHPILLYVISTTCDWCHEMDKTTFQNQQIISIINKNYYPIIINGPKNRKFLNSYQVNYAPTVVIIDQNRKAILTLSGYYSPENLLKELAQLPGVSENNTQ